MGLHRLRLRLFHLCSSPTVNVRLRHDVQVHGVVPLRRRMSAAPAPAPAADAPNPTAVAVRIRFVGGNGLYKRTFCDPAHELLALVSGRQVVQAVQ